MARPAKKSSQESVLAKWMANPFVITLLTAIVGGIGYTARPFIDEVINQIMHPIDYKPHKAPLRKGERYPLLSGSMVACYNGRMAPDLIIAEIYISPSGTSTPPRKEDQCFSEMPGINPLHLKNGDSGDYIGTQGEHCTLTVTLDPNTKQMEENAIETTTQCFKQK